MAAPKYNMIIYVVLFIIVHVSVRGYPVINSESLNKDEKQYPNGTVIGKYTYTDNDGNPIHVKYYADDASYGVELNSVKLLNSNLNSKTAAMQKTENPFELALDPFTAFKDFADLNNSTTLQFNKDTKQTNNDVSKYNVEYETFIQNELKAPEKCGKEKVKVYFDKDKRKIRNVVKRSDILQHRQYCNRF